MTYDRLRELLHYDPETGIFRWLQANSCHRIGDIAGGKTVKGYTRIGIDGFRHHAQNFAWMYMTGEWPEIMVDHVDLDKANNKWSNLRKSTHSQNRANERTRINNTSGYKGVSWDKKYFKWHAYITVGYKRKFLGYFQTPEEGHAAYCKAAEQYFGKFARAA